MSVLSPQRIREALEEMDAKFAAQGCLREWTRMMEEGLIKTKDVIRVEINDDGTVNLLDFTIPTKAGMKRINVPQEDVDTWIMETISMLRIATGGDLIPTLGFKVSDQLYYILNREGEME
jgi:hypothetical protein